MTPFHSFLEEVAYYEKHHWECDKCGDEIRRMINRKPQPADCSRRFIDRNNRCCDQYCHWHMHSKYCNGHYVKVRKRETFLLARFLVDQGAFKKDGIETIRITLKECV